MKLIPIYLDNDGNIIRKKKQIFYKKNRNKIPKLSRKRNRHIMNISKKRKRQNKRFTRAVVKSLKDITFEQLYEIPIKIFESYRNKKIVKEYEGKDKACEPVFSHVKEKE